MRIENKKPPPLSHIPCLIKGMHSSNAKIEIGEITRAKFFYYYLLIANQPYSQTPNSLFTYFGIWEDVFPLLILLIYFTIRSIIYLYY